MALYKVYRHGNYLEIIDTDNGQLWNVNVRDARIFRHDMSQEWFDFYDTDKRLLSKIFLSNISDKLGNPYTLEAFEEFIKCSFGLSVVGESCQGFTIERVQSNAMSLKISSLTTEVGGIRANTTLTNGVGPFTYSWEWADSINSGFSGNPPWFDFVGSTTASSVKFDVGTYDNAFSSSTVIDGGTFGLLKCTVNDSNGNSVSDTYLYIMMISLFE